MGHTGRCQRVLRRLREANLERYTDVKEVKTSEDRMEWQTENGGVALEMRGSRVAIVEGVPSSSDANTLLRSIWQQK